MLRIARKKIPSHGQAIGDHDRRKWDYTPLLKRLIMDRPGHKLKVFFGLVEAGGRGCQGGAGAQNRFPYKKRFCPANAKGRLRLT